MSVEHSDREEHDGLIGGRFEIVRALGDGAFAVVYEAIDRDLGRRVALKLFSRYARDELELALREARAMARLNHQHVLAVHDVGEHRGTPFLALEFAEMDLHRWLAVGSREPETILHLFGEAGQGLAAAHRAGLVHHDFKPANVMLRADGSVAVGDFGLARHIESQDDELEPSDDPDDHGDDYAFGTLRYIAPERLLGLPGDARSDQFSFCVAAWEALAGQHPFGGSDAQRRYDSITGGPAGMPRAPAHVRAALRRGLAVTPDDRFETMDELLAALAQPRSALAAARSSRWLHRSLRPVLTAGVLAGVFALGLGLAREAPALDVSVTPPEVLTANAGMDQARDLAFDGDHQAAVQMLMTTMPVVRETAVEQRRDYLAQIEVLGDLLLEDGAPVQASWAYAAAKNLAEDLGVDTTAYVTKADKAHARARRVTRGK